MAISRSSLQSKLSYAGIEGPDCTSREPGSREGTEGLEGGGAAAGVAPKAEGVRLPTELDVVDDLRVNPEEIDDGGVAPREQ